MVTGVDTRKGGYRNSVPYIPAPKPQSATRDRETLTLEIDWERRHPLMRPWLPRCM
jgi:hypothetical protein